MQDARAGGEGHRRGAAFGARPCRRSRSRCAPARSPSSVSVAGPSLVTVTVAHLSLAALVSTASVATSVSDRVSVLVGGGRRPRRPGERVRDRGRGPVGRAGVVFGLLFGFGQPAGAALTLASLPGRAVAGAQPAHPVVAGGADAERARVHVRGTRRR